MTPKREAESQVQKKLFDVGKITLKQKIYNICSSIPLPNVPTAVTYAFLLIPFLFFTNLLFIYLFLFCKKKWITNTEMEQSISNTIEISSDERH